MCSNAQSIQNRFYSPKLRPVPRIITYLWNLCLFGQTIVLPASFIQYHMWTPPTWPHHSSPVISVHQEDSSTTLILLYFTRQQQSQSSCTRFPFPCAHWRLLPPPLNLAQLFCKNTMNLPALSSKLCQNNKRMNVLFVILVLLIIFLFSWFKNS